MSASKNLPPLIPFNGMGLSKFMPSGETFDDEMKNFAAWAAARSGGEYKKLQSFLGYVVWIAYIEIDGSTEILELYLHNAPDYEINDTEVLLAEAVAAAK